MTGRDILRILRKRKWLIIIAFLTCAVVTMVGTLLWATYAPIYTAEAFLAVDPPKLAGGLVSRGMLSTEAINRLTLQQVAMVKREEVLVKASEAPRLRNTEWFRKVGAENVVKELDSAISVSPRPNTNSFRISMTGVAKTREARRELAEIVMAMARAFIKYSRDMANKDVSELIGTQTEQKRDLNKELTGIRKRIVHLRPEDSPSLREGRNVQLVKLQALTTQLIKAQYDAAQLQAAADGVQDMTTEDAARLPQVAYMLENDPLLRSLRAAKVNMTAELPNMERKFGPEHQARLSMQTRLKSIQNEITNREKIVLHDQVQLLKETRRVARDSAVAQLLEIQKRLTEESNLYKDLENKMEQILEAQTEVTSILAKIERIDNSLLELRLRDKAERVVWMSGSAPEPRERAMPQWKVMISLGIFLGLLIGVGGAFILEFIDTSIKSPTDISRRMDLPILGVIPHTDDLDEEIENLRLAFATNPGSLIGEAFRQMRTGLLFSGPASQRKSLLVTSPSPGDGRTFVSLNLGAAMAHGDHKVLVVDANFRQPMIHKLFDQCPQAGLSNVLVERANWRDLVRQAEGDLYVMSSGPLPPNPAELLGSPQMRQFIADATAEYDRVIFDGAPCLVVTDGTTLSTLVDGVILVVRAGSNTFGILQRSREMFTKVGAHLLGAALNGIRATSGGYLRQSYETFYEYRQPSSLPSEPSAPAKTSTPSE